MLTQKSSQFQQAVPKDLKQQQKGAKVGGAVGKVGGKAVGAEVPFGGLIDSEKKGGKVGKAVGGAVGKNAVKSAQVVRDKVKGTGRYKGNVKIGTKSTKATRRLIFSHSFPAHAHMVSCACSR